MWLSRNLKLLHRSSNYISCNIWTALRFLSPNNGNKVESEEKSIITMPGSSAVMLSLQQTTKTVCRLCSFKKTESNWNQENITKGIITCFSDAFVVLTYSVGCQWNRRNTIFISVCHLDVWFGCIYLHWTMWRKSNITLFFPQILNINILGSTTGPFTKMYVIFLINNHY